MRCQICKVDNERRGGIPLREGGRVADGNSQVDDFPVLTFPLDDPGIAICLRAADVHGRCFRKLLQAACQKLMSPVGQSVGDASDAVRALSRFTDDHRNVGLIFAPLRQSISDKSIGVRPHQRMIHVALFEYLDRTNVPICFEKSEQILIPLGKMNDSVFHQAGKAKSIRHRLGKKIRKGTHALSAQFIKCPRIVPGVRLPQC